MQCVFLKLMAGEMTTGEKKIGAGTLFVHESKRIFYLKDVVFLWVFKCNLNERLA